MSYVNAKQVALLETPMTEEQYQRFQSSLRLAFYAESSPSIDKTNPDFQAFYAANVQSNLDHIRNNAFVTIPLPEVTNDELIEILMNHANFSFELRVEANVSSIRNIDITVDEYDLNRLPDADEVFETLDLDLDCLAEDRFQSDESEVIVTDHTARLFCVLSVRLPRPHIFADQIDSNFNPANLLAA